MSEITGWPYLDLNEADGERECDGTKDIKGIGQEK